MKRTFAFLFVLSATCASYAYAPAKPARPTRETEVMWFYDALRQADSVQVLEGLPHHMFEREERELEIKRRATFAIARELFYEQRLTPAPELIAELTKGFLERKIFLPPLIGAPPLAKACGGFHADYGLSWLKKGEILASALICFGCHDILLVGPTAEVMCGMTQEGDAFLAPRLKPLRGLRPPYRQLDKVRALRPEMFQPEKPQVITKP